MKPKNYLYIKRLFAPIAAGGSTGAILGPLIAAVTTDLIGIKNLLLISALLLILATFFIFKLIQYNSSRKQTSLQVVSEASIWDGLKLMIRSPLLRQFAVFILLYTTISTFLYFEQAHIVSNTLTSSTDRTAFFGLRDLLVNATTLILQFLITEKMIRKWGVATCLVVVPIVSALGFLLLGFSQSIYLLLVLQIAYRSLGYAVQRPSREILFTVVSVDERYKSKNFIDTTLYRGGDALSGWLFAGLASVIASLQIVALVAVPIAIGWLINSRIIGKMFLAKSMKNENEHHEFDIQKKSA